MLPFPAGASFFVRRPQHKATGMRILIPTVDYPPIEGGISTVALQVSRELAAAGHEVTVAAPAFPGMESFDAGEPSHVVRVPGYNLGWLRMAPFLRHVLPLVKGAELVLAINITYGGAAGYLGRLRHGAPYVTFAYAYEFLKFQHTPAALLLRRVYKRSAATVAISRFTRDQLVRFGVPAGRITLALPGAPAKVSADTAKARALREQFHIPAEAPLVFSLGRFIPRKGQLALVRLWPRVLEACPGAHLILAGRGPTHQDCLAKAESLGLTSVVHCPGYLDDSEAAALHANCDVFALLTGRGAKGQVEGFGLVFAEAHAHGKPVVAGRSGGTVDAVVDGETGYLVDSQDEEAAAAALIDLLSHPAKARRMGEAGRRRVEEELNWRVFTQRVLEGAGVGGDRT